MKCKSILFTFLTVGMVCLLSSGFLIYNGYAQTNKHLRPPVTSEDSAKNFNEIDSILKWKHKREFAYISYLDSLLRKQKYLRSDTVSFDENTGRIIREHPSQNKQSRTAKALNSRPLQIFFWIIAIGFIVFIFYKIFQNPIFTFKKKKSVLINNEETEEPFENAEYDTLIEAAEENHKFNYATRYLFLKTLKNLSEKRLIEYAPQKTNKDYLKEMNQHKYFDQFEKLTAAYEYAWYGKFLMDKKKYLNIKETFYFFNENV